MKRTLKALVSFAVAAVMLFAVTLPAFAETGVTIKYPIVVVNGIECNPLVANPDTYNAEVVFPPSKLEITATVGELLSSAVTAMASGDYDEVLNLIVGSHLYEKFNAIQLNPDGTSKSANLGVNSYSHAISYYNYNEGTDGATAAGDLGIAMAKRYGGNNVYVFTYDWRLDPIANAAKLKTFVDSVKKSSHRDKVTLLCEGTGANVVLAYLSTQYDQASSSIHNCVFVNSAAEGTSLMGDLFTGSLFTSSLSVVDQTYPSALIRYTNDVSDNPATWFAWWLTNYILNRNWEIQSLCYDISVMMSHIKDPLYDKYLRSLLQNFVGLWALVPVDYYDDAIDFIFYADEEADDPSEALLDKIYAYKSIQHMAPSILENAQDAGLGVSVVSSWELQLLPIGDNTFSDEEMFGLSAQSDGLIDTYYSSFGATTIPIGDVGAAAVHKQVNTEGECAKHNHMVDFFDYLDPKYKLGAICHYIDASTCALPENTWFIHDMKYGSYDPESNACDFIGWLVSAEEPVDVWTDVHYMQFMNYNRYVKPGYLIVPYHGQNPAYLLGDADGNGVINATDARLILRISANLEDYPEPNTTKFLNCDVNCDGIITAADARITLRVSAGLAKFSDYIKTSDADA